MLLSRKANRIGPVAVPDTGKKEKRRGGSERNLIRKDMNKERSKYVFYGNFSDKKNSGR